MNEKRFKKRTYFQTRYVSNKTGVEEWTVTRHARRVWQDANGALHVFVLGNELVYPAGTWRLA